MKKVYKKPVVEVTSVECQQLMENSGTATVVWTKETSDFEEENETGIPDSYTSIWGDEEEKED
jgi:hypothetical protein